MKRPLFFVLAATASFGADLSISDFSSFTPGIYSSAFSGAWSAGTAISGSTTFTIGQVGSGPVPSGQSGNGFTTFIPAEADWSGYSVLSLTGSVLAGNATPSLSFYVEDAAANISLLTFDLSAFRPASGTVSLPLVFTGGVDPRHISVWGFVVSQADSPAFGFTFDQLSLSTTAVPEPAAGAILAGAGVLAGAMIRRRQQPRP